MSIYRRQGELSPEHQERLRQEILGAAKEQLNASSFSSLDSHLSPETFRDTKDVFEAFMVQVYQKAAKREFFTSAEKMKEIDALEHAVHIFVEAVRQQDVRLLQEFEELQKEETADPILSLIDEIHDLEELLERTTDEAERKDIGRELEFAKEQFGFFKREIRAGRMGAPVGFSEEERHHHAASVRELGEPVFDARVLAETIVDAYERLLMTGKITMGVDAHYSDEEILPHLAQGLPDADPERLRVCLEEIRKKKKDDAPETLTTFAVYRRVLSMVFGDHALAASTFAVSAGALGYLSPQMAAHLGEFGRTGDRTEALLGSGLGSVAALGSVELDLRLNRFLTHNLYGETGILGSICEAITHASPELFNKTDHALLRSYIGDAAKNIEYLASTTVQGIGVRVSRIVGLSAALAYRMQNPALFAPVLGATLLNTYIAFKGGTEIWEADREVRETSAEFFSSLDEAMHIKQAQDRPISTRGDILAKLEERRVKLTDVIARYGRPAGLIMPLMFLSNAFLIDTDQSDFFGNYAEASMYSMQLATELSALIQEAGRLQRSVRPLVELGEIVQEFKEQGAWEPERWDVDLYDAHRKSLHVPELKLPHGDFAVVVGESGAGKSTFVEILYGFGLDRGLMHVDDTRMSQVDKRAYRNGIQFSNQFYALETKSLRDNVTSPEAPYDEAIFLRLLKEHGLDTWLVKVAGPERATERLFETVILNKGPGPSGGEKKRLSLFALDYQLRAAPHKVKMIILDEPTSGVDVLHKKNVYALIAKWRQDFPRKTMVIVNHDKELFEHLDPETTRILGIEKNGTLSQDETLAQAGLRPDAPFAKLFG